MSPDIPGYPWPADLKLVDGRVRHPEFGEFDGTRWNDVPSGAWQAPEQRNGAPWELGCSNTLDVDGGSWCGGPGRLFVRQPEGVWQPTVRDPFAQTQPRQVWGTMPTRLWVGGDVVQAWGSGPDDVYRVGLLDWRKLEHFDGTRWSVAQEFDAPLVALDGAGLDVWLATPDEVYRRVGSSFVPVGPPATGVSLLKALPEGRVLVATRSSLYLHDGQWRKLFTATSPRWLGSFTATSPSDITVVEVLTSRPDRYFLYRSLGSAWLELTQQPVQSVFTAHGIAWGVTEQGGVVRLGAEPVVLSLPVRSGEVLADDTGVWVVTPHQVMHRRTPLPH